MKWVANLPDSKHTPFPVIAEEPHIKTVVQYFRPSDYLLASGITLAGPGSLYLWGSFYILYCGITVTIIQQQQKNN